MTAPPRLHPAATFLLVAAGTGVLQGLAIAPVGAGTPMWTPVGAVAFAAVLCRRPTFVSAALLGVVATVPILDARRLFAALGSLAFCAGLAAVWNRRARSTRPEFDLTFLVMASTTVVATVSGAITAALPLPDAISGDWMTDAVGAGMSLATTLLIIAPMALPAPTGRHSWWPTVTASVILAAAAGAAMTTLPAVRILGLVAAPVLASRTRPWQNSLVLGLGLTGATALAAMPGNEITATTAQTRVVAVALAVCLIQVVAYRLERERERAARTEATHRTILDSLAEALLVLDGAGRVLRINPAAGRLFAIDPDATMGTANSFEGYAFTDRDGRPIAAEDLPAARALGGHQVDGQLLCMERPDGTLRWISASTRLLPGCEAPEDPAVVMTVTDVTTRHEAEMASRAETTQLRHRALHDGLTGLPNRTMLMDRLGEAQRTALRRGAGTGLIVVDLDGFKGVNDHLGHAVGDEVLVQVALRLRSTLRSSDTAARLGGDEFVVLCEDLHPGMADLEVRHIAQRLQELLNQVYVTTSGPAEIGASVGWAIAGPGETLDLDLVVKADEAMLADKRERKGAPEEQRPEELARSVTVPTAGEALTVYIVDDDPAMRLLAGRILESSGTDLIVIGEAADGETAIREIDELAPDLVLCDVMMPVVSGPDVVVAVRRHLPDQRFIFWSATSAPELERFEAELQVPFVLKDRIEELPAALLRAAGRGPSGARGVIPQPETTVPSR
ncbi:diguanylate cyclase domain-containing protein [Euzebya rosea]|uniref:diguanylate cyclase domain-containing protein n=1 Tax=Euzebya rosea TaxID=2052804 RepID=UPI000D3E098D|nr:diguanylate cyclase [Euzebya rosea]